MKKIKRIAALIGVVLLLSLYGFTLFAALTSSPNSPALFQASIFCSIVIPIMLYAYILVYRLVKKNSNNDTIPK